MSKNKIANVINGIIDTANKERHKLYDDIVSNTDISKVSIDDFYISFIYPFENYLETLLENKLNLDDKQRFFVINSEFFKRHFEKLFSKYEGSTCCVDKASNITWKIYNFLKTGEVIEFNYNQEYTFHLPEKILKTHQEIIAAYEALQDLFFGSPDKYILFIKELLENLKDN